ncbi:Major facilitator superfamily transporter [Cordyceps fumosorosea ARSEF 2679]|uniref:Major facilitator superfamily transporter n=1 Tax=Cordyceps fumosorosea (strain ARSEF 2679) TaxID=1081104 RepID=A0A167ZG64_CORFA|nr:Major facilitator superfamily transporter [Cordyceps fumosorosea ARSEF 2679]OAA67477.1 Major facilitator superfamily transporter [Cordyceps fumosorosea ARSEF 2679]
MAKDEAAQIEVASSVDDSAAVKELSDEDSEVGFSEPETSRLLRKLDRTLLPFLSLLYLLSFLDRSNIGNAKLAGLEKDLNMTGYDYSTAVAIFFPFYVLAEVPSNMAMKRFRPSIWIPSIMVVWGFMTIMLGLVKSFGGLLAVRSLLGLAEGGLFPGITYYITMWYRRHECGLRMAIFFSAATAAGAFGGLLARGIMEMSGVGGLNGWSWIFILEGLATFLVALIAYRAMHDYPESVKFLRPEEKKEVVRRLKQDRSALSNEFKLSFAKDALKDWKIWVHMFITIGIYIPLYSISVFLPTIVKGLGYTNEVAQLMSVPPYVVACLFTVGGGFLADRHGQRGIYMVGFCAVGILGFALLAGVQSHGVKYFACFLVTVGVYPNVSQGVAWNGNNIGGSLKRAVGIAMHVGFGNLGGAISGYIYAREHFIGHLTLVGTLSMSLVLSVWMHIHLRRENARRDAIHKPPAEYTYEEKLNETEKGDDATFFRYTV